MLPSEAISKLLEGTFDVVEEWARECKKNLNEAQDPLGEAAANDDQSVPGEGPHEEEQSSAEAFAELIGAFKDAEEQMMRVQGAALKATQAFVQTLKSELEPVIVSGREGSDSTDS
jgi:hypothetical protein